MLKRQITILVAEMFTRWKIRYGNKMKAENWGIDTINDWADVLFDMQITPSEFEVAKRKAGLYKWMISHPVEFLELARGVSEYPNVRDSYEDAAKGSYSHGVCLETARRVGFNALRMQDEKYTFPLWQKHYKDVCTAHTQGEAFELPQLLQIESKQPQAKDVSVLTNDDIELMRAILAGEK